MTPRAAMSAASLGNTVALAYADRYGRQPDGVWFAPGRVNLIGEHTDYNQGLVLPFALDAGVAVAAGRSSRARLEVWSAQGGTGLAAHDLDSLSPGSVLGWAAYPFGVAWALLQAGYGIGGASIVIDSDLPVGAGLSSSAALECAVALALADLYGCEVPRPELAALASRAENEFAGAPTGIMDQSAALLGRPGRALLLDCRSGAASLVPLGLDAAGLSMLAIDTVTRHDLADGKYGTRRRECEAAARALGVPSLRDLPGEPDHADLPDDPVLRRRARHVVTENRRVEVTAELLRRGEAAAVGAILTRSHQSLRDDFEVSWPQADAAVSAAVEGGALGARMMGGGFGGSVLALLPAADDAAVRHAVLEAFGRHGWPEPAFMPALPADRARRLI
jgi:galactokinase